MQQRERVAERRRKRLQDQHHANAEPPSTQGTAEEGLVIAHFGLNVEVEDCQGTRFRCAVRKSSEGGPVCGDRVVWQRAGDGQGVIQAVRPRSSVLQRPMAYQRLQTIAANVSRIFIVVTATDPNMGLLDRYLVAAALAQIEPLIVINKLDLIAPAQREAFMATFAHYEKMGYRLFFTSTTHASLGLGVLLQALEGHVSVFVGESGTGKSSLVSQWVSSPTLKVGAVNQDTGKGRHTTTVVSLYHLPQGGHLIDSPGIRAFGLHAVPDEGVGRYFHDIATFLGQCRFSDCRHEQEPRCAVQQAVQAGHIHPARLESFRQIQASLLEEASF